MKLNKEKKNTNNNFFNRNPWISLVIFNLFLSVLIFSSVEYALKVFTPDWLANRMIYLNPNAKSTIVEFSDNPLKEIQKKNEKNEFISFEPNSKINLSHYEYSNEFNMDKFGGRKVTSESNNDIDTLEKIIFIGDSFTFGVGVEDNEVFCSLAQKDINPQILNFGRPGSSLPRDINLIKLRLPDLIRKYKINNIIFCWFLGNDAADILNFKKVRIENKDDLLNHDTDILTKLNKFVFYNRFLNKIYLIQYVRQKVMNIIKDEKNMDPVFHLFKNKKEYTNRFSKLTDNYLNELNKISKEYNFKLTFLLIPDRYQINDKKRELLKKQYNISPELQIDYLMPNKLLTSLLIKNQIDFIDPIDCIKNESKQNNDIYYIQDNHFTKKGHQLYYNCIKDKLLVNLKK